MWVTGHSRSLKVVPFESLGAVFYSPSIVTMAVSVAILEIFSVKDLPQIQHRLRFGHILLHCERYKSTYYYYPVLLKNCLTLKSGFGVLQGH